MMESTGYAIVDAVKFEHLPVTGAKSPVKTMPVQQCMEVYTRERHIVVDVTIDQEYTLELYSFRGALLDRKIGQGIGAVEFNRINMPGVVRMLSGNQQWLRLVRP
ncbi:MAG: hypothetical protein HQK83_20690 [Fibrobacteria bacterium]|nr:hypothetical protein [Fibrobacteria bacterium]